jgi:hypothetical protein
MRAFNMFVPHSAGLVRGAHVHASEFGRICSIIHDAHATYIFDAFRGLIKIHLSYMTKLWNVLYFLLYLRFPGS